MQLALVLATSLLFLLCLLVIHLQRREFDKQINDLYEQYILLEKRQEEIQRIQLETSQYVQANIQVRKPKPISRKDNDNRISQRRSKR